ncbi:MAG: phosphate ABC transporter substrate-binding protein [Hyphomicrobium sp. 32-62-53]|nr:MAG: phosphate ABC transporter substrate-binding protein [Hyphomicrobium sp. 12-62-95]OYX98711.1 MAG: phosphate ABC transporter substrate-binding protein [Hyphomicrobium sp. 32-62-53]
MNKATLLAVSIVSGLALTTAAEARDQIRIVGSSTVYPFTTAVAEQFGKASGGKTPVVESTGTGGGMKIFCEGVGVDKADGTNASRRIKKSEFELCDKNGVKDIIELTVGYDGLTIAQSKDGPQVALTRKQVFQALAEKVPNDKGELVDNPYKNWSDIDPSLPNIKIEVLGPPPTSGTRDSFHELFMEKGAEGFDSLKAMKSDKAKEKDFEKIWKSIRKDGAYVEAGENDNVIVQKLEGNKNAFGIFGFSFLEENADKLKGVSIEGAEPTFDNISGGKYKGARPLFVYFKKAHIGVIPGLDKFIAEYTSEKALGAEGYLTEKGLVALPKEAFEKSAKAANEGMTLKADELK